MDICPAFPTHSQTAELMQPRERALDNPARGTEAAAVCCIALRQQWSNLPFSKPLAMGLRIVTPVTLHSDRAMAGSATFSLHGRNSVYQALKLCNIVNIGSSQAQRQRNPLRIGNHMVFTAIFRTIRGIGARLCPPKTARIEALSTTAHDQSIPSPAPSWFSSTRQMCSQIPACCHSRKRRQQVMPEPHPSSLGSISQGIPERSTKIIPVNTARFPTRGRPPLGLGDSCGKDGAIISHKSSLNKGFGMCISSTWKCQLFYLFSYPLSRFC